MSDSRNSNFRIVRVLHKPSGDNKYSWTFFVTLGVGNCRTRKAVHHENKIKHETIKNSKAKTAEPRKSCW